MAKKSTKKATKKKTTKKRTEADYFCEGHDGQKIDMRSPEQIFKECMRYLKHKCHWEQASKPKVFREHGGPPVLDALILKAFPELKEVKREGG